MLIRFTLENWMSIRDEVTFSMISSKFKEHDKRIPNLRKYNARILPISAIYGGNASGKTNLVKALSFAKRFVVNGSKLKQRIHVDPFRLNDKWMRKPSRFCFEILVGETIYEFDFSVTSRKVSRERLVKIEGPKDDLFETIIYERNNGKMKFGESVMEKERLRLVFDSTRDNQLFLTNSINMKVKQFRAVYEWFNACLVIISPESRYEAFEQYFDEKHPLNMFMNEVLPLLDTGIERIGGERIVMDSIPLSKEELDEIQDEVQEGVALRLQSGSTNMRFLITRDDSGKLSARRVVTSHIKDDESEEKFDISQESDGSQRLIDLLPAFLGIFNPKSRNVFVIDEIDRSLHTKLTWALIQMYLGSCSRKSRTQLLFTTHDMFLMDKRLMRLDEMWLAERSADGASSYFSLCDFDRIHEDEDIKGSYALGRFGGIPRILLDEASDFSGAAERLLGRK